ncbi:MAG: hypothetical protein U0807_10845 [Candidatus Binatia bacterium]
MDEPESRLLVDRMVERCRDVTVKPELVIVPERAKEAKRRMCSSHARVLGRASPDLL